jgi:hypothetical protein
MATGSRRALAVVALAALLAAGCGGDSAPSLPQGAATVALDPADFVAVIDNPYLPLLPGSRWVYREQSADGGAQRVEVTVTKRTREILGIAATIVHDVVRADGGIVEDTWDWYAQDRDGNVWYLGEDTKELRDGEVVSTAGSWEAGVDGAQAGIAMPAEPEVGLAYRQEYAEGEAEDAGEVLSLDERAEVPFGSFERVLQTKDWTPLEPDAEERKYYAEDVGPVLAVTLADGSREELVDFRPGG